MNVSFWAAISGLNAAQTKLDFTAHNIANVNTDGYKHYRVVTKESSPYGTHSEVQRINTPGVQYVNEEGDTVELSNVDLAQEVVNLMISENTFKVNLQTIKTQDSMLGSIFDILR